MGACMSHRVEYPNEIHPNIFTVAAVGRVPASRRLCDTQRGGSSNNSGGAGRKVCVNGGGPRSFFWSYFSLTASSNNERTKSYYCQARRSISSSYGQLEVTPTNLIYHRKGHEPVSWPLHYVKRYGFENNIFSFESGRRSQWQGVFTFRCRVAHQLFSAVQTRVQDQSSATTNLMNNDDLSYGIVPVANVFHATSSDQHVRTSLSDENSAPRVPPPESSLLASCSRQRLSSQTSNITDFNDDEDLEQDSQVFIEVTPAACITAAAAGGCATNLAGNISGLDQPSVNHIRRRSALSSCCSSKTSNSTLPLVFDQQQPTTATITMPVVTSVITGGGRPKSADDQLSRQFEVLVESGAMSNGGVDGDVGQCSSAVPYYVNVDTTNCSSIPSLRNASSTLCVSRPLPKMLKNSRTRSVSSDSKVLQQQQKTHHQQYQQPEDSFGSSSLENTACKMAPIFDLIRRSKTTSGSNYVNFPGSPTRNNCEVLIGEESASELNYTAVNLPSNMNNSWTSSIGHVTDGDDPCSLVFSGSAGHRRRSSAASTGGQMSYANPASASRTSIQNTPLSTVNDDLGSSYSCGNYAQIDCAKTKALRDTAAQHRQTALINNSSCHNNTAKVFSRHRTQSANLVPGSPASVLINAFSQAPHIEQTFMNGKATSISYSDGVPVRRNKRDCCKTKN